MATEFPSWYGRDRGSDLSGFYYDDPGGDGPDDNRGEVDPALSGTAIIAVVLVSIVAIMALADVGLLWVLLAGAASAIVIGWCFRAEWEVSTSEDPSTAALVTVGVTSTIGQVVFVALVVAALVTLAAFFLGLIAALSSDR